MLDQIDQFSLEPAELHPELMQHLHEVETSNGGSMRVLKHPLMFSVPYHEIENSLLNKRFAARLQRGEELLSEGNFDRYIFLHERPFRPDVLHTYSSKFDDAAYWSLVRTIWQDTENAWQMKDLWQSLWTVNRAIPPGSLMLSDEETMLRSLPDLATIYRGYNGEGDATGLSWTLDRNKATWFARRWLQGTEAGVVVTGNVQREHIIALLMGRNESEVVVDPDYVNIVSRRKVRALKRR